MTLVVGTDEAGYGPNLGPLVVAATAWRIAAAAEDAEALLAIALSEVNAVVAAGRGGSRAPLWADSKQIYRGGTGFSALERGVSIGLGLAFAERADSWAALAKQVGPISPRDGCREDWQDLASLTLPHEADATECLALSTVVRTALGRHGVSLERIACRGIYPAEFNALLDTGMNKSDILSAATLDLAAALRDAAPNEAAIVWCDRHGGRKRYGGLVSHHFAAALVRPLEETPDRSVYIVPACDLTATNACRIEFCVGGEARGPVALASMTAKYVRELAMHAFNTFWSSRLPGLRPTAGYPTDALRWRHDAAAAIQQEQLAEASLWRRA
jgi:ribonuclease HII